MDLKTAYDEYHKKIVSLAFHQLSNIEEAEDVTQEVFMKYEKQIQKEKIENVRGWLYRVTYNECMDRFRLAKRVKNYINNLIFQSELESNSELFLNDDLKKYLDKLNPTNRMIILLKYIEGMDYHEISDLTQIKVGTLKSIVSRSLNILHKESSNE